VGEPLPVEPVEDQRSEAWLQVVPRFTYKRRNRAPAYRQPDFSGARIERPDAAREFGDDVVTLVERWPTGA